MGGKRQRYNEDFKRETVKYIQSRAKSMVEIAEELNIPVGTFREMVGEVPLV